MLLTNILLAGLLVNALFPCFQLDYLSGKIILSGVLGPVVQSIIS